jgi:hypothetical protein
MLWVRVPSPALHAASGGAGPPRPAPPSFGLRPRRLRSRRLHGLAPTRAVRRHRAAGHPASSPWAVALDSHVHPYHNSRLCRKAVLPDVGPPVGAFVTAAACRAFTTGVGQVRRAETIRAFNYTGRQAAWPWLPGAHDCPSSWPAAPVASGRSSCIDPDQWGLPHRCGLSLSGSRGAAAVGRAGLSRLVAVRWRRMKPG